MPKQLMENDVKDTIDAHADFEQRRDGIENALKVPSSMKSAERQELQTAQENALRNSVAARDAKVASVLAEQRNQLDAVHGKQIELMNQALEAASRIEKNGKDGPRQALQILNDAADLNRSLGESSRQFREQEISKLKNILSNPSDERRNAQLDDLLRNQKQNKELLNRDADAASFTIARNEALAKTTLDKETIGRLDTRVQDATRNDRLRTLINDEVLQRLAHEALAPGTKQLEQVNKEDAAHRVQGELAEVLAATKIMDMINRENIERAEGQKLQFIAGNRVRDDLGKLSDGLIIYRDHDSKLRLWAVIEVKSGNPTAVELNRVKMDEADRNERRNYQLDVGKDALLHESGQLNQTVERLRMALLDDGNRLYIDGRSADIRMDSERQWQKDFAKGYVADDAIKKNNDVERLGVNSQDLNAVATAFVDELLRQRKTA